MTLESLALRLRLPPALIAWLPARRQLRDLFFLVAGNLFKIALGFATSSIIFRALGPNDAGRLTLTLSLVGLLSIVGEFGLRDAAVNYISGFMPTRPDDAYAVGRTFFLSKIFLSALASAVGIFGAGLIAAQFYPDARVQDLIQLGALSLFTSGLLAFALVILEAQKNFAIIGWLNTIQAVVRAVLIIALFLTQNISLFALILLEALIPLIVFIYSLRFIPRAFLILRRPFFEHFGTLFHFTKWIAVAAFGSAIFLKLDVLMLSYYRAPAQVGLYAVALALVTRLDILKNAVLTTAFPDACRRAGPDELRAFIFQSIKLTALASLALLPLFAIGAPLIEWLYGTEYSAAIPAFYLLFTGFIIGLNAAPVAFVLYPLNRPRWIAASDLLQLAFNAGVNFLLIPPFGIIGAAWGVVLTRVASAVITFVFVRHFLWSP